MDQASGSALQVEAVGKDYEGLRALRPVTLHVEQGERVGIIGPNGAGKSTLFRMIDGTERPTTGRVLLFGDDVTRHTMHRRARAGIGRTFQITDLFDSLDVETHLRLAADRGPAGEARRIAEVAARLGIEPLLHLPVGVHSYGQQRLVELAIALCTGARLLLLDEPAAGLGPEDRDRLRQVIHDLPRDITILLIEHDMDLMFDLVDRIACLANGVLIAVGTPDEIRVDAAVRAAYLGHGSAA
jgi:branched-chain amino acid transport system ATP-binding protein